jgi:thiamine pyrophosphokinase
MIGLVFTGGRQPDMTVALSYFGEYSLVAAADSGLDAAFSAGIEPDYIVGDMDSLSDPAMLDRFPADRVRRWPRDKDYTDTELALALLSDEGCEDIILIGGSGGRMDHFFALKALFDKKKSPSCWIGDSSILLAAGSGCRSGILSVSGLHPEEPVSVFPAGSERCRCRGKGFYWEVDGLDWDRGGYSLSNRSVSGTVRLEVSAGRFLLVLPLRSGLVFEWPES